ncbi:MAG: alpha-2-macroglobulin family protein, partial [Myxococcota bacterium]
RIMAVAVAGARSFGSGESTITARLPIMVRPSPPRFLNFGDTLELPVVLQNQTDDPMTVDLAMRTSNLPLTASVGRRVVVPAGDRVEVRFGAKAALAGTARAQLGAVAGKWADAASFEFPVWTPATTEAFATYGEVDSGGVVQPVKAPPGVFEQFGGLEITTSSTAVQALTDAVLYLVSYPYECSEQISSRVLAVASLRDVLSAFETDDLPSPEALVAAVDTDIKRLARMQADDGGFSFWGGAWPSWPYLTIHVAHAMERARLKGFTVPKRLLSRARTYLRDIERHFRPRTSIDSRRIMRAYALYVLNLAGKPSSPKANALIDEAGLEKLPLEALAWLLPTLAGDKGSAARVKKIHRHFGNRVAETAADAHFVTGYDDGDYVLLHSDRRADALILEALVETDPSNDLIPKLVRGLLDHRTAGAWSSTQENGFVLLALDRYFNVFEKVTPDFVASAWLGDKFAGKHKFKGRTTERHHIDVPMKWLADAGASDLVLDKKGKGRMYYRVGMRYAPRDLKLPPYDAGFVVQRRYEAIDDPADVRRDRDGTWHIKAGARVRVRVTMVADGRRYHVALVDPLPAGLEAVNPVLATTGALPDDPEDEGKGGGFWWWMRPWYEHQNLRDERVEAFASLVWDGVHDFDYIARATTPGRFVVPPAKAEEMYHPETFGRGAGDIVVVEATPRAE